MSETASNPRAALSVPDPMQVQVPAQLLLRSGRPLFGTAIRVYVGFALVFGAMLFVPRGPVFWGMIGAGVLAFALFPVVIQGLLAPLERRVLAAGRGQATALLQEVRTRRLVRRFAPHAWLTLQEGRLHLRRGDGRAAARAFSETLRLSRSADAPALISAQAQALVLAEQYEPARELLQALARRQTLSPGDQLQLGLALLGGKGNGREALAHIEAAQAGLGELPRVLAALALALHRADQGEAALMALQRAQERLGPDPEPFDEALVQRGVKLLRTVQKALERRERKLEGKGAVRQGEAQARVAAQAPASVAPETASPVKSARKAKKEERRASRRAAKAEKRTPGAEAPVRAAKAAKVAPKGKAARAIEPHKLKAAPEAKVSVVKPVEPEVMVQAPVPVVKPVQSEVMVQAPVPVVNPEIVAQPEVAKPVQVVEQAPVKPEIVAQPVPSSPAARPGLGGRPELARSPAPPSGSALFGSLSAKPPGGSAQAMGAPPSGLRLPPRPQAASASPPVLGPPAPGRAPAVPNVMSSPGAALAGPPILGAAAPMVAPSRPPQVAAPQVSAPVLGSQAGQAPLVGGALAQALPDTDDGWDDMLDALEADGPRS